MNEKTSKAHLAHKDVTELHHAGALLSEIFNNTYMLIAHLDVDFNYVLVNRAYAEACHRDPDSFIGKNIFEMYPDPATEAIFHQVRDTGQALQISEQPFAFLNQPDRSITYWDGSLHHLRSADGEMQGILFYLLDATERVRARQRLVDSERQYRELVENANSIILRITPDGRIMFFNEYAQHFFGFSSEEVMGKAVFDTILPEIDSKGQDLRKMMEAIIAAPEIHLSNDNENICKDGRRVRIHWSNRAIRNDQGEVQEILRVGTDITERHRLECEAELYRRRLRQLADRLATVAEQERHRISTHLHDTVIQTLSLGNIRLGGVQAAVDAAGLVDTLGKVESVRTLLVSGIAECRGLMADLTPPLLYELGIGAALRDFADKQQERFGQYISVEADDPLTVLDNARRGILFQSAREFVVNAMKHAGPCRIAIRVFITGADAIVEVRDTGIGFDPAIVHLFEADDDGGFGLFNVRERVHSLGGRIDIESSPGQGTTARIAVPAAG